MQPGDVTDRIAFRPVAPSSTLGAHAYYDTFYDPKDKGPFATFYWGTPGRAVKKFHRDGKPVCSLGNFHADPLMPGTPPASAYVGAEDCDIGHMVPAESMMWDYGALSDTYDTSNVWPQRSNLNRGAWAKLEAAVFNRQKSGKIGIITGCIFLTSEHNRLPSGVSIPDMFFKVIFDPADEIVASYVMPNEDHVDNALDEHYVPIEQVAHLSGVAFPALSSYKNDPGLLDVKPKLFKLVSSDSIQHPKIEDLLTGEYVLIEDYVCNPCDAAFPKARIRIKAGFITDFGTTGPARGIYPPIGTLRDISFLLHDGLYASQYFQWLEAYKVIADSDACRAECDWRLLESLQAAGDDWHNRNVIWSAVKLFGGSVWSAHTPESIAAARTLIATEEAPA